MLGEVLAYAWPTLYISLSITECRVGIIGNHQLFIGLLV